MNMNRKQLFPEKQKYVIRLSILIFAAVIIVFTMWLSRHTIEKNVAHRVTTESEFLARQQAELINQTIEEQFKLIDTIGGMIENGISFYEREDRVILKTFVDENELSLLGYADLEGNVISYKGKILGNISGSAYFQDVITGKKDRVCQYLDKTEFEDMPRIIFATAVWQNGEIKGMVCFTETASVLKNNLFQQSMFEGNEAAMIVDGFGNILAKNDRAEKKYVDAKNLKDITVDADDILSDCKAMKSGSIFFGIEHGSVFEYSSVKQNDWFLICSIDTAIARHEYASNLTAIHRSILALSAMFVFAIIYFLMMVIVQIRNNRNTYIEYKLRYERVLSLLQKMKCMILEYDIRNRKLKYNASFDEAFGYGVSEDFLDRIKEEKDMHPEFNYEGMVRELNYAIEHKVTTSFESMYCVDSSSYKIFSIVMMPVVEENQQVTKVLGSVRETSDEHVQLKEMVDMFTQIPGGTYRSWLRDPIHLDYVGENFCKMLGYTVEEFWKIADRQYINLVIEEDREKYRNFIREAASGPGVRSCEYRVYCKDGRTLAVLDKMETLWNDSGMIYGYSVVVDIPEYVKRQNIAQQELEQMKQNLEMMRVQNSTSQMQPHFLYNALASIREIVLLDPQYASDLICDFTTYLRACIRTMQNGDLIPVRQEIDNIQAYANIEKMRMGKRLNVVYDLKAEDFQIVPLSIQPLVENAIRHGIYQRGRQGGTVTVRTESLLEYDLITVEDNGVGFDYQKVRDEVERGERDSIGLDNVIFRLKKQLNADVVINSELGVGTVITVRVPRERKTDESDRS